MVPNGFARVWQISFYNHLIKALRGHAGNRVKFLFSKITGMIVADMY